MRDGAKDVDGRMKRGRLGRYGPVLAWVVVIYIGSTATASASNTSRFLRPLMLWLFPEITEPTLASVHAFVRKAAHFTEYAVLGLLAARAFLTSPNANLRRRWYAFAFAVVLTVSLLDEYHQSFLAARTGSIYDSLLDMSGGACALAALALWRQYRER